MLSRSEVLHGVLENEIKDLEEIDHIFFRLLFQVPRTTPIVSFYLETGTIPFNILIRMRRLKFLHYIVNLNKNEMLHKVFWEQWKNPIVKDWTMDAKNDLIFFGFDCLDQLRNTSYNGFKSKVNIIGKNIAFKELMKIKETKSKLKSLNYTCLTLQPYLELNSMNTSQALSVFKFRVRMVPCENNYKTGTGITGLCPWCGKHADSQEEMFNCNHIASIISIQGIYKDLFQENIAPGLAVTAHSIYTYREEYRRYLKK